MLVEVMLTTETLLSVEYREEVQLALISLASDWHKANHHFEVVGAS